MSRVAELLRARRASPVAVVALISAGLAGCSGDSHRFAENPFNSRQQEVTGTVPPAQAAPSGRIESRPLPQYAALVAAAADHAGLRFPAPEPVVRYLRRRPRHRRLCAARAPDRDHRHDRAALDRLECELERGRRHHNHRRHQRHGRRLAQRYNVPAREIMRVNGLPTPRNLQPGQSLVIPRQVTACGSRDVGAADAARSRCTQRRRSRRQSGRDAAQHRPQEQHSGRKAREGQQSAGHDPAQDRHEDHRARHEDGRSSARATAETTVAAPAKPRSSARGRRRGAVC